jgi:hypothetical protein
MRIARTVPVALLALAPNLASSGQLWIGFDKSAAEGETCHMTYFYGPAETVRAYQQRQTERFEPINPTVVARLSKLASVSVKVETRDIGCIQNSGTPEKIVVSERESSVPLLTIPLDVEHFTLTNLMGATFPAANGSASVALAQIAKLRDRELVFHLIYSDHVYKDKWRKHYAAEILRQGATR